MASKAFLTVSFSGGGHLLTYHLGVASVLLSTSKIPPIRAVSGSSAGAVAAVVMARLPHRLKEYTELFINTRGKALERLQDFVYEEESFERIENKARVEQVDAQPSLHIATTRCSDGSLRLFDFDAPKQIYRTLSTPHQHDRLIACIRASCAIPSSFHPIDVLASSQDLSYPNNEGVQIDGDYLVDGGIAGPAPPTPLDNRDHVTRVVVSPMSGKDAEGSHRISPMDSSLAFGPSISCKGEFYVRPSIQNLRALIASTGIVDSQVLRAWCNKGVRDAERFVENWKMV